MKKMILAATLTGLTGCVGKFEPATTLNGETPVNVISASDNFIVRSRNVYLVSTENGQTFVRKISNFVLPVAHAANPTAIPISVTNAPSASMTVDLTSLVAPTQISDNSSFGSLKITALTDNNLRVCGTGNQKCGLAVIRMYTTGVAGAGLYNASGGYGAPITAGLGTARAVVGLGSASSAIVQSYIIPQNDNRITPSDFTPSLMQYNVDVDFSNAGAGTYSTTLVVEYALGL